MLMFYVCGQDSYKMWPGILPNRKRSKDAYQAFSGLWNLSGATQGCLQSGFSSKWCWWLGRLTVHEHPFLRLPGASFPCIFVSFLAKLWKFACACVCVRACRHALRLLSEHIRERTDNWLPQRSRHFTIEMCEALIAIRTLYAGIWARIPRDSISIMVPCLFLQFPRHCPYWTYEMIIIFCLEDAQEGNSSNYKKMRLWL